MGNSIQNYNKKLDRIYAKIEKSLCGVNSGNFSTILKNIDYEQLKITNNDVELEKKLKKIENRTGIYFFKKTCNSHNINREKWKDYKTKMNDKKNNVPDWNDKSDKNNTVFYLGSSENLKKRVLEHIGGDEISSSTYALKLKCFNKDFKYNIYIFYLSKNTSRKNFANAFVEKTLHSKLSPNIGRS